MKSRRCAKKRESHWQTEDRSVEREREEGVRRAWSGRKERGRGKRKREGAAANAA